ncbi:MAG: hypothetical protein COA78_17005 [Blastopirellula sp.]|nr:MAG: hypothetical protein COA78_17005 [Blastopirellula sp.]
MNLDDDIMDLLIEWEDRKQSGQPISLLELANGDTALEKQLETLTQGMIQTDWVHHTPQPVPNGLDLPSKNVLTQALTLPDNLTLEGFLENLKKAELCEAEEIKQLIEQREISNVYRLVNALVDMEMLTRFQVRAVAHGKTKGLTLGNYQILDKIGEGGMGTVYQARHNRMDRIVALKVLVRGSSNKTVITRFLREAKTAARLSHPNIVETYDSDETHGYQYLVMEYIEGQDLRHKIKCSGALNVSEAVDYIIQVARGLEYAHNEGIIHRDIKPSNLVLDTEGCVKILDLGLARVEDPDARQFELTQAGSVMGTVDYMPPEQAIDTKTADRRADLYSLGCTLHYLLTGKPPFEGETIMVKMLGHREQTPPDLTQARQDVHPQLNRIFQKLMAKLPEARYQTAGELIAALESIQDEIGSYEESIGTVSPKTPDTKSEFDTSVSFDSETQPDKVASLDLVPDNTSWLNFNISQVPLIIKIVLIVSLVLNLVSGAMFIAGMLNTANKNNLIPPPDAADIDSVTFGKVQVGVLDASVTVNMQDAAGKLDAWIDFSVDGIWGTASGHQTDFQS